MSFAFNYQSRNIHLLVSSSPSGLCMYFYFKPHPGKEKRFATEMQHQERVSLTEFGDILESGVGDFPSEASIAYMKETYGFDPDLPQA